MVTSVRGSPPTEYGMKLPVTPVRAPSRPQPKGPDGVGVPHRWSAGAGLECSACKRSLAEVGAYCRLQMPMGDLDLGSFACACSLGRTCAQLTAAILQRGENASLASRPRADARSLACADLPSCFGCMLKNGRHLREHAAGHAGNGSGSGEMVERHRVVGGTSSAVPQYDEVDDPYAIAVANGVDASRCFPSLFHRFATWM